MFATIYTVQRIQNESTVFRAYFEEYDEAKAFAEQQVKEIKDDFTFGKRSYPDGSFQHSWTGDHNEIVLNDFAWLTDYRTEGVCFYDESGLTWPFSNYENFKKVIIQKKR